LAPGTASTSTTSPRAGPPAFARRAQATSSAGRSRRLPSSSPSATRFGPASSTTARRQAPTSKPGSFARRAAAQSPPSCASSSRPTAAAPARAPVVVGQAAAERLVGERLHRRLDRRPHREPALVEPGLAEPLDELAADLLDEERRLGHVGDALVADLERLGARRVGLGGARVAVLLHPADHVVAALAGRPGVAARVVGRGRLRQAGQERGLGHRELVERLVEVGERRRGHAVGARSEEDLVQVELQDLVLRERRSILSARIASFTFRAMRELVAEQEVLRHLLGDGGGPGGPAVAAQPLHVRDQRPGDALNVEPGVGVEVLVLGGDEGLLHPVGMAPTARTPASRARTPRAAARPPRARGSPSAGCRRRAAEVRQVLAEAAVEQDGGGGGPDHDERHAPERQGGK
jgi:hypothetical protein